MKNTLLSFLFLISSFALMGQTTNRPISIAYFSQFGFQPGAKIATEFKLKELSPSTQATKHRHLFISPQIGFFVRPQNNTNLLFNADVGIKQQKEGRSSFSAFSLGLGYLHQLQISTVAIQLGDGGQSASRSNISYFLPTLNYAFGNQLSSNVDWYSKIGLGQRFGGNISSTTTILLEIGLQFNW